MACTGTHALVSKGVGDIEAAPASTVCKGKAGEAIAPVLGAGASKDIGATGFFRKSWSNGLFQIGFQVLCQNQSSAQTSSLWNDLPTRGKETTRSALCSCDVRLGDNCSSCHPADSVPRVLFCFPLHCRRGSKRKFLFNKKIWTASVRAEFKSGKWFAWKSTRGTRLHAAGSRSRRLVEEQHRRRERRESECLQCQWLQSQEH